MRDIIQIAYGEPQMVLDNEVMKAVGRVGISVNKEELVKALELSESLVRCKECEYKRLYDGETKYYYCALEDRPNRQWSVDDTDFCSWGERKAEPQTDRSE